MVQPGMTQVRSRAIRARRWVPVARRVARPRSRTAPAGVRTARRNAAVQVSSRRAAGSRGRPGACWAWACPRARRSAAASGPSSVSGVSGSVSRRLLGLLTGVDPRVVQRGDHRVDLPRDPLVDLPGIPWWICGGLSVEGISAPAVFAFWLWACEGGGEVFDPDGDHDFDGWVRPGEYPGFADDHVLALPVRRLLAFPVGCLPVRCLPVGCRPVRCLPVRCLPVRCLPVRCLPVRCLPVRCLPVGCVPARAGAVGVVGALVLAVRPAVRLLV